MSGSWKILQHSQVFNILYCISR